MRHAPAVFLSALGLAACATTPGADSNDAAPAEPSRSSAVLFVERQATDTAGTSAHVGARFVQFTDIEADALPDLLGTPHLPGTTTGCYERPDVAVDSTSGRAEARLLDVGPIDVRAGDRMLHLEPRRFPDLWNVVSGVIYATDGDLPTTDWRFTAPGSAQSHLAAFDVEARAPEDLAQVSLADQPFAAGSALSVPRRAFSVHWARGDRDDGVVLVFDNAGSAERPGTILCTARDEGSLDVDANWAERIAALSQSGATLTVHRVRVHPFAMAQVDSANVVFDLSLRGRVQSE